MIQDLGYFPFGSRFFSNLLHYVRTGDFVEAMIREAQDLPEYAFALGALAHYFRRQRRPSRSGQPIGGADVSRSCARKYGSSVTYADSPSTHVVVEFSFDVVQVATGRYRSEAYQRFIGFEVAKPVLERAFQATYGLEMKDVFLDADCRSARTATRSRRLIPQITRIAWRDKHDEIVKALPGIAQEQFVYRLSRAGVRAHLRHQVPPSPACSRGFWRCSTSCCRRSGRCAR